MHAKQLLRHLPIARAPHQQVLGAENLGGLGQHRRAAQSRQQVRAVAQRGVGGDAGKRIRPAAVQPQHDLRSRRRRALFGGRLLDESRDFAARRLDRAARAAAILQRQARQPRTARRAPARGNGRSGWSRIPAPESPPPKRWDAPARRSACAAVGRRRDRKRARSLRRAERPPRHPRSAAEFRRVAVGDQLGGMRRAIAGRHHRDVVARAHAAVLARVALKSGLGPRARRQRRFRGGKLVIAAPVPRTADCGCGRGGRPRLSRPPARWIGRSAPPWCPRGYARSAILWPAGMASSATTLVPSTRNSAPAAMGTRATATLSCGMQMNGRVFGRR